MLTPESDTSAYLHNNNNANNSHQICNVYNMSGRVVSDIQTRAEKQLKKRLIL